MIPQWKLFLLLWLHHSKWAWDQWAISHGSTVSTSDQLQGDIGAEQHFLREAADIFAL